MQRAGNFERIRGTQERSGRSTGQGKPAASSKGQRAEGKRKRLQTEVEQGSSTQRRLTAPWLGWASRGKVKRGQRGTRLRKEHAEEKGDKTRTRFADI